MVNFIFYVIVGAVFAFYQPFEPLMVTMVDRQGYSSTVLNHSAILWTGISFLGGMFIASVVRFVRPKRVHVITLLGTTPVQKLQTGIRFTLPWPFGYTHRVVPTDVQDMPIKVQVKPSDNLVYHLPVNAQWYVMDAMKFAIERDNPEGQAENLLTAAIRKAANNMTLFEMYGDKDSVQSATQETVSEELKSFGIAIKELVVQDPDLPESTATKLSAIREAELDKDAATHEAEAKYVRMVGSARAEAESTRLKGSALANFRLLIAEGNAAAIAVMQGKLSVAWEDETIGEGDNVETIKVAKFVKPDGTDGVDIPTIDVSPEMILEFFKVVDSNDAIRDASANPGTTVVLSTGASAETGIPASLLNSLNEINNRSKSSSSKK
ncbi:MAG: hypothetical protein LR008_02655 [Candidatus Pacebacteria bacterium]|nr:hypothetical protein [Candidatus Paceibacterota bacterium]